MNPIDFGPWNHRDRVRAALDTNHGELEATRRHEHPWTMLARLVEDILDLENRGLRRTNA